MKTLIISLNSKYIHASLASWYLKAACDKVCGEVVVLEHTINESFDDVLTSIYLNKPDLAAFSCYIWNISFVTRLASSLKKILPGTVIVLGGPEVSYDSADVLRENPFVDYVLSGEGENSFPKLVRRVAGKMPAERTAPHFREAVPGFDEGADQEDGPDPGNGIDIRETGEIIEGLAWRQDSRIRSSASAVVDSLDSIPSPYTDEMISSVGNRIVYFETSRGCPFACTYCLSSASSGTRFFSLERVFEDLDRLVAAGVKQIKFVDRTFNCNRQRALAILRHILELDRNASVTSGKTGLECNFHFEVGADLFDEELLEVLLNAPKGLFQMEAGVQTTNESALAAVNRKTDLEGLFRNLNLLHTAGNIHIHSDLIAGLPKEDYDSFGRSFDRVYLSCPNQLQLGFLKFLKGTRMREEAGKYGFVFNDHPPYEILSGPEIGYDGIVILKGIAELVERYYNSGRFAYSLNYIIQRYFPSPFRFYERFYQHCRESGCLGNQAGLREWYAILSSFASTFPGDEGKSMLAELLRLDFLASDSSGSLPGFLERRESRDFHDRCFEFLRKGNIGSLFPELDGLPSKQAFKKLHFDIFHMDIPWTGFPEHFPDFLSVNQRSVLVFCYLARDRVTGRYPFHKIFLP